MGIKRRTKASPRLLPPIFETPRLLVRRWRLEDSPAAFVMYSDPEVMKYIGGNPEGTLQSQRDFLRKSNERYAGTDYGGWALWERGSAQIVGTVLIKPLPDADMQATADIEIGWHLRRDRWGEGFATECGRGVIEYGFQGLGLTRLLAVIKPDNAASIAVARRLGMQHRGRTQEYYGGQALELFAIQPRM